MKKRTCDHPQELGPCDQPTAKPGALGPRDGGGLHDVFHTSGNEGANGTLVARHLRPERYRIRWTLALGSMRRGEAS
ncbi:MAG TPA: hypothetical protein VMK12_27020, partial [Anaeromyxobacteraceae bacterium]|nr:hypothetical protein [Anaeromyxobacteraceae bacterium]